MAAPELDAFQRLLAGELSLAASLRLEPAEVQGLVERAIQAMKAQDLEGAERLLRGISLAERRAYTPAFLLGACRLSRGDAAGAVEAFEEALARGGLDDPTDLAYELFLGRAQAYARLGLVERARADLRLATRTPDPAVLRAAAGLLQELEGR